MKKINHLSSNDNPWGKSFTPKRYLHPPFAENIITMWPSTILLIGEAMGGADQQDFTPGRWGDHRLPSSAMVFLYRDRIPDFKNATYKTRNDGIPIHTVVQNLGDFSLEMESFCNTLRVSTIFTKLVIRNNTDKKINDKITLLTRTAPEYDLLGIIESDGYTMPDPSANHWKHFPNWNFIPNGMTDGKYTVQYQAENNVNIIPANQLNSGIEGNNGVYFSFELEENEQTTLYFAFGRGGCNADFSYTKEKENTIAFWENELQKINKFPNKQDPFTFSMFRSLVAGGLQMFMYPKGCNYALLRQGGLQRRIWPTEARSMIEALTKIGDFENYLDAVLNTYYNVMQAESGEIINFGMPWASVTGAVLDSFSEVGIKYEHIYQKYKDNAYKAFCWMEEQRQITRNDESVVSGLFPPAVASDYPGIAQWWSKTDAWNLMAYEKYSSMLQYYNDKNADNVKNATDDYKKVITDIFENIINEQKQNDYIILPCSPKNDPESEAKLRSYNKHSGQFEAYILLFTGIAGYGTEITEKIVKYFTEYLKEYKNGLVLPFPEGNFTSKGTQWYVNWSDYKLYFYYRRSGQNQKAKEILDAQISYAMTDEFYMIERYDDTDPYFTPWCPNCSANGRTILMLCDWYGNN